jgi:hypothetical protein
MTTKRRKRVTINKRHRIIEVETELLYGTLWSGFLCV